MIAALLLSFSAACQRQPATAPAVVAPVSDTPVWMPTDTASPAPAAPAPTPQTEPTLKYMFLFIGDGMGPNQVNAVNEARAALSLEQLLFTAFPAQGALKTDNAEGDTTDSAAAATALATGYQTENGVLGQDFNGKDRPSVAEQLHANGRNIGILTTVSLDHATPAGFYAHTDARTNYDTISRQLLNAGFAYFAGGGTHATFDFAAEAAAAGYALVRSEAEALSLPKAQKLILKADTLTGDFGMKLALDGANGRAGQLARFLSIGIERLDSDSGFFIMTEGGRIDLAGHYHDGGDLYAELLDFDEAVRTAYAFYLLHPQETLIVVTADHETGGLTLSEGDRAALSRQTVSCDRFDEVYASIFQSLNTPFESALTDVIAAFGLTDLTQSERDYLAEAYRHTLEKDLSSAEQKAQYGVYAPITSAAAQLVSRRAGLSFGSFGHTGTDVPVYAVGVGSERFVGTQENTAVYQHFMELIALYGVP